MSWLRCFYLLKPLIPRRAQIQARRWRARRIWRSLAGRALPADLQAADGFRWPDGYRAAAIVTHDVETGAGQREIPALLEIEQRLQVRACYNFVIRRYEPDESLMAELRRRGHEIGVHGVHHDGKLFSSRAAWQERLPIIMAAADRWQARGFRSPSLLHEMSMLQELPLLWDSSLPTWDPFQPQPGGCRRCHPFPLNERCIELPVSLWQDFTLFEELQQTDIRIWRQQIERLHSLGGLINVIVHPDYMATPRRRALYEELLELIRGLNDAWQALPAEVAQWAVQRLDAQEERSHENPGAEA
jgi:hypothetical protein